MAGKYLKPKTGASVNSPRAHEHRDSSHRGTSSGEADTSQTGSQSQAEPNPNFTRPGSSEERAYLDNLVQQFQSVDSDYMDYVKKQEPYNKNKAIMREKFSGMSGIYYRQIMLQCVMPLRDGVSKNSLAQCIGMYLGMSLVDKNFKSHIGNMFNEAKYTMYSHKAAIDGPDSPAAKKAAALKRDMIMHDNGGREPFNPRSAALTKIAMTVKAYGDMREPGADVERIRREYMEAIGVLDEQIVDDGMSVSSVDKEMRTIVGQMCEDKPEFTSVFHETNYDGVKRAPYHKNPDNPNQVIWTGEYFDKSGRMYTGSFTPREPLTVERAAEMKYKLAVDTHNAMRTNGADIGKIQTDYLAAMDDFSRLCAMDGVDELDVNKKMRHIVGQKAAKDPSVGNMFMETAFGLVDKAPGVRDPENPNRAVWSGEYQTQNGRAYDGAFTPRPPMSADVAAQLKVELVLRTYDTMRVSGVDAKKAMQEYKNAMSALDKQCKVDQLDQNDINQSMRIIVGDLCERNPAMAVMFKETAYDGVEKAPSFVDGHGQSHWTGEYVGPNGVSFEGGFTPRMPHGYKKNLSDITASIDDTFANVQDGHELHDVMIGYSAAYYQVLQGVDPADSVRANPHYQNTVMLMQMAVDDGADLSQFEKDVTTVFSKAYNSVPTDIVDAYKRQYTSAGRNGNRPHPDVGHDNVGGVDHSSKGRGADAARRLGLGDGSDGHSGADIGYNPS